MVAGPPRQPPAGQLLLLFPLPVVGDQLFEQGDDEGAVARDERALMQGVREPLTVVMQPRVRFRVVRPEIGVEG